MKKFILNLWSPDFNVVHKLAESTPAAVGYFKASHVCIPHVLGLLSGFVINC